MIGETAVYDIAELVKYYGKNLDEFHIPFNFITKTLPWNATAIKRATSLYYAAMPEGATPNFVFGSHDIDRLATRFGPENHRSVAMLLLTLWGIPTLYYADELGMENVEISSQRRKDPFGQDRPDLNLGRDPERTPMQWDASPNAGFSRPGVETWLPVGKNFQEVNVASQQHDPMSTLHFYKTLLRLRREMPALHRGDFNFVKEVPTDVMSYVRSSAGQRVLVIINFEGQKHTLDLSSLGDSGKAVLSSRFRKPNSVALSELSLKPHESLLIDVP
jgi:alpha-glucosidase